MEVTAGRERVTVICLVTTSGVSTLTSRIEVKVLVTTTGAGTTGRGVTGGRTTAGGLIGACVTVWVTRCVTAGTDVRATLVTAAGVTGLGVTGAG